MSRVQCNWCLDNFWSDDGLLVDLNIKTAKNFEDGSTQFHFCQDCHIEVNKLQEQQRIKSQQDIIQAIQNPIEEQSAQSNF